MRDFSIEELHVGNLFQRIKEELDNGNMSQDDYLETAKERIPKIRGILDDLENYMENISDGNKSDPVINDQ